jgi:hypothetical protein
MPIQGVVDYERYGLSREEMVRLGRFLAARLDAPSLDQMRSVDFEETAAAGFRYRAEHDCDPPTWDSLMATFP